MKPYCLLSLPLSPCSSRRPFWRSARPGVAARDLRQLTFGGRTPRRTGRPTGVVRDAVDPAAVRLRSDLPAAGRRARAGTARLHGHRPHHLRLLHFPAGERIIFSSTHHAGEACPAPPDQRAGYVWALYPEYELYSARLDGSDLVRLTDNEFYDAEATVCRRDGSIVFTSTRDGDLELYRMDADGGNLLRLTHEPGYDGGAFFSPTARGSSGAPPVRRAKSSRSTGGCSPKTRCAEPDGLWSPTPTARKHVRSPTSAPPPSRRSSTPRANGSSSPRTRRPTAGNSTSGRSTSTAAASSGSPPRPASTASRSSPDGSRLPSPRTATRRSRGDERLRGALGGGREG